MFKCPKCEYVAVTIVSLSVHWRKKHKLTAKQLYVDFYLNGIIPTCACGCGEETKFWDITRAFSKYKRGHIARIHNNWGHNETARVKSQNTRQEMYARGEIRVWTKGMTKEEPRIKALIEKGRQTIIEKPGELQRRSDRMRINRLSGVVPTLSGSAHPQWKGGVSALQPYVRSRLFNAWSRPIMQRDEYTCQRCGAQSELCVHHDAERFAPILMNVLSQHNIDDATQMSFEQKTMVANDVIAYHEVHNVTGMTLCRDCHDLIHQNDDQHVSEEAFANRYL